MSWTGRLMAFFPVLILALIGAAIMGFVARPGILTALAIPAASYAFPLASHRIHERFHPAREGVSHLRGADYSPWWGSHQIQLVYHLFPFLEAILRAIPGAFSAWLRLWGSEIGEGVYWTPTLTVADRGTMSIGDGVIFGERCGISAHAIKPTRDGQDLILLVRRVRVGAGCFIGAGTVLSPGTHLPPRTFVPAGSVVGPGQRMTRCAGP